MENFFPYDRLSCGEISLHDKLWRNVNKEKEKYEVCPHHQHHRNDNRRRKRWSGSVRDAESDGDILAAHLHQVRNVKI